MLRTKRDVDRHVEQLEAKIRSESERNLKAFTIAKLYFNVGANEDARRYLAKYISVRENSAAAFKMNGQVLEALQQRDKAIHSYKTAYELDLSQKEIVLKICELLVVTASTMDRSKARYWLEQGEKNFPRHKIVSDLRSALGEDDDADNSHLNGDNNGNDDNSSPEQKPNLEDSILWSGGASSFLNGSRAGGGVQNMRHLDTPDRSSTPTVERDAEVHTPRRFVPRPSPERLAAQVHSLESTQGKLVDLMINQNRQFVEEFKEHSYGVLQEMKHHRQSVVEEMKTYRQNVSDLKIEMKQGLHDLKLEVSKLGHILKEHDDGGRSSKELIEVLSALPRRIAEAMPPPPPPPTAPTSVAPSPTPQNGPRPLALTDLQEALAQQTALLQMSSLGFAAGMFARPPVPSPGHLQGTPPAPQIPTNAAPWHQPHLQHPFPGAMVHPEINLPTVPLAAYDTRKPTEPHLTHPSIISPPQQPAPPAASKDKVPDKPHDYQINLPKASPIVTSPFKSHEGPAVPIITTSLLSGVPPPVFSSLSKSPAPAAKTSVTQSKDSGSSNLFDKFKPKEGSWECGGCMTRNQADQIQCPACETVKPGHEEEVKKKEAAAKPAFSFGAQGGFKFTNLGSTATTTNTTTSSSPFSGFSFTSKPADTTPATTNFTFANPSTQPVQLSEGHLSFEGQSLKLNTEADAKEVVDKIVATKKMTDLTFSGNTVGIDAAKAIGVALEKHPEFKRAHWKDMLTGRMKTEIPPALKHLSSGILKAKAQLVELDLSDNALGPIGMEGITDLLKSPSCYTLQELKLNNTGCGVTGGKLLAKTLLECYHASKKAGTPLALRVFILGRSRQENEGAKALAAVFKLMGSLEEVIMPQNGIFHEGIAALADAFANNPNLHTLNMNDNTFTEKGAASLAGALPKLQKLNYLNIGDCLLKTEGALLIAEALKQGHGELEELHMDSNEIRLNGGEAIVSSVVNKPKMKQLCIGTNCFGEEGCQKLMEMLGSRTDLVGGEIEDDEGDSEDEEEEEDGGESTTSDKSDEEGEEEDDEPSQEAEIPTFSFGLPTTSAFGSNSTAKPASASPSIFGGGSTSTSSIFGGMKTTPGASIFGTPKDDKSPVASIFGTPAKETSDGAKGIDFSASKNLPSFATVSSSTPGFAFGTKPNSSFSFAGAGSTLFKGASPQVSPQKEGEDEHHEDHEHDPHFEPIIPLPELVKVTTGEEDEEVLFKHRAKVFRYDTATKQWKERGIGDMKILKHSTKNTFRILLRREQIHKIACNHLITKDMELKPMLGSETAVCWFAMDFADEESKMEQLAVKFKLEDTKNEFKRIFQECQGKLATVPQSDVNIAPLVKEKEAETKSKPDSSEFSFGSPKPSLFGNNSATKPASASPSIFGGNSQTPPSIFGVGSTSSIFGGVKTATPGTSIFSTPKDHTPTKEPSEGTKGIDFSAAKNLPSFATVSSSSAGFAFGTKPNSSFSFAGAGSTLFKGASPQVSPQKEGEDEHHEDHEHDPHFEPIIPLPELVKVTTGEEDEEVIFKHRAKVFRYDSATKQWKERGIGDIKILKHSTKNIFRILLRREQIHKIACNHLITKEMELNPMLGSETALCWFAMDFADEESKMEQLAVKFKLEETKNEFKRKFQECQGKIAAVPQSDGNSSSQLVNSSFSVASEAKAVGDVSNTAEAEEQDDEDYEAAGEDDDDEEEEENVMYERQCYLFEISEDAATSIPLGHVELRIIYDDDVYGARIVAYILGQEEDEDVDHENQACNHLIAMQTSLNEADGKCTWSALDFSLDPPTYRTFQATFKTPEDMQEFRDTFYEGKELADQSEILELPPQSEDAEQYYYGEGGDYEQSS